MKDVTPSGGARGDRIRLLRDAIRDGDVRLRENVIHAILSEPGETCVSGLIGLLSGGEPEARMTALKVLKQIACGGSEGVRNLARDPDPAARAWACELLDCDPDGTELLLSASGDPDPRVRAAACVALGASGDVRALAVLVERLHDVEWVAFAALQSLGAEGSREAVVPLLGVLEEGGGVLPLVACEALLALRDRDVTGRTMECIRRLPGVRREGFMRVIVESGDVSAIQSLKEFLGAELFAYLLEREAQEHGSLMTLRAMALFPRSEACEAILTALAGTEEDTSERELLFDLFLSTAEVWRDDIGRYLEGDPVRTAMVVRACASLGVQLHEEAMLDMFARAPLGVKREVSRHLRVVEGRGLAVVRAALSDEDGHVRANAAEAAAEMGLNELSGEIEALARTGFPDVRRRAMASLAMLDPARARSLAEAFVSAGTPEDKKVYLAAASRIDGEANFSLIRMLLDDSDEFIRKRAMAALGEVMAGDDRYHGLVARLLEGATVPHEVLKVVRERRLAVFEKRLRAIFEDHGKELWTRYYALCALASFGRHELVPLFVEGLEDESTLIRIGSVKALADLGGLQAAAHVKPLTESPDATLRSVAEAALEALATRGRT